MAQLAESLLMWLPSCAPAQILQAKEQNGSGVVFAWWGSQAQSLKKFVMKTMDRYPSVKVAHVDHFNPAAMVRLCGLRLHTAVVSNCSQLNVSCIPHL